MEALIWVVTGGVAGWVAGGLMKGRGYGLVGNILIGLLGSLVGGWLMQLLGGTAGGAWWQRALVAALGAVVVLVLARALRPIAEQSGLLRELEIGESDLEAQLERLNPFQRRVVERILKGHKVPDPNQVFEQQMTFGERVADRVAAFGGSWTFIGLFLLFMLLWMILNTQAKRPFDVFPFILLNLILSCLAALQAPVIMMSQNRQAAKDRNDAKLDYEVNLRAESSIGRVLEMIEQRDALIAQLWEVNQQQLAMLQALSPSAGEDAPLS